MTEYLRFTAIMAGALCVGTVGMLFGALLLGAREMNYHDVVTVYLFAGAPSAAIGFHLINRRFGRRVSKLWVYLAGLIAAHILIPPFADYVVHSELTGDQGHVLTLMSFFTLGYFWYCLLPRHAPVPLEAAA